jgi:hypothetical protein
LDSCNSTSAVGLLRRSQFLCSACSSCRSKAHSQANGRTHADVCTWRGSTAAAYRLELVALYTDDVLACLLINPGSLCVCAGAVNVHLLMRKT